MSTNYIPGRGDIIRLDLNFEETETDKRVKKNALVISPKNYNDKTSLAIVCPIKSKIKGYPFEVVIPDDEKVSGVILADQVKSVNWKIRNAEFICKLADVKFSEVVSKLLTLL
jgi:mRNA interferase MazF